jgi:type IV pilus assembly protein PilE
MNVAASRVTAAASASRARGFTLIELMITVAIVAILTALAYPSYQQYVRRGKRSSAKAAMMNIASLEQQYLLATRTYADTPTLTASGYAIPADVAVNYTWAVAVGNGAVPTYTITFTGTGPQAADNAPGPLTLDQAGNRTPLQKWGQ